MSSDSEFNSSSSDKNDLNRYSHSRSRDRNRKNKKHDWDNQSQGKRKKTVIKIPELSGYLVQFSSFMNNQSQRIDTQKLKKAYDKYKKDWENKQNQLFLIEHKNDSWFIQKYDPQFMDMLQKQRNAIIRINATKFNEDYKRGYYQNINLTILQPSLLGQSNEVEEESNNNQLDIHLNNNIDITTAPYFGFNPDLNTLFIKNLPKNISRYQIKQQAKKIPGFLYLSISEPVKKLGFIRYCWLTYDNQQSFNKAFVALSGLCIKDTTLSISKSNSKSKKIRVLKFYPKNRIQIDCKTTINLIKALDKQENITQNLLVQNFKISKSQFDLNLLYLRKVHAYDYFSAKQYSDERTLSNKLGLITLRIQTDYDQQYGISSIFKRNQQQAEKRSQNPRDASDPLKILRDELLKLNGEQPQILQEKTAYKCSSCNKKFISNDFLSKHLHSKHGQLKKKVIDKILENNFLNDPNKIIPFFTNKQDYGNMNHRYNNQDRQRVDNIRNKRNKYSNNFKSKKKQQYQDLDDPSTGKQTQNKTRSLVNFLDI